MPEIVTEPPDGPVSWKAADVAPVENRAHEVIAMPGSVSVQLVRVTLSSAPVMAAPPLVPAVNPHTGLVQIALPNGIERVATPLRLATEANSRRRAMAVFSGSPKK